MDSPYKPGFGARPAVIVGRDAQIARVEANLTRVQNSGEASPTHLVFTGARGLGKTVTLAVAADRASERGFLVAGVSMDRVSDNVQMLAATIAEAVAPLHPSSRSTVWKRVKDRLTALSIEINAGVVKIASSAPGGGSEPAVQRQVLAGLLAGAAQAAQEQNRAGLVLLLDELGETPSPQLVVLANAIQDAAKTPHAPVCVIAAGLPQTPDLVMAAASFAERFDFRVLGRLDDADAERALVEPALAVGVRWQPTAAATALHAASGSPYLIQYIGDEAWMQARPDRGTMLTDDHVTRALTQVRENLDNGMFRGRWSKATPAERAVIIAIAQTAGPAGIAAAPDVSTNLGVQTRHWSMARQSLIDKGIIEPVSRGQLRFTMPGFAAFVEAQANLTDVDLRAIGTTSHTAIAPPEPSPAPRHSRQT